MWILHFIPDSILLMVIFFILAVGTALVIAGLFLDFIPVVYLWKHPILIVGSILMGAGLYFYGGYGVEQEWRARVEEMQKKVAVAEEKSQKVTAKIHTRVVTRVKVVKEQVAANQTIIQQNKEEINKDCRLTDAAIGAYNQLITSHDVGEVHIHE